MSDEWVMEWDSSNLQDSGRMSDVPIPQRPRSVAVVPLLAAAAAVVWYVLSAPGRTQHLVGEAIVAGTNLIAAASILSGSRAGRSWRSARSFAVLIALLAGAAATMFTIELRHDTPQSGAFDVVFLLFLVPILGAARAEYHGHFPPEDRREIAIDATLIGASLAAIAYVIVRPLDADATQSLSAATFAIIAAALFSAFGVLGLGVPAR
jgi:hypothetical protein